MAEAKKRVTGLRAAGNASFDILQKIGKSLMLPVAVLPVAGLLLGIGASNLSWLPPIVSHVMASSGQAVFGNLPLIFAVGVALGLANNDGVSAIAAVVGYYIMVATLGVMGNAFGLQPIEPGGPTIDTGVFGGIIIGMVAAGLFNRYYRIQLPAYLAFFAGKRFVPIVTGIAAIFVGGVLSLVWPPVQWASTRSRTGPWRGTRWRRWRSTASWKDYWSRSACTTSGMCHSSSLSAITSIRPPASTSTAISTASSPETPQPVSSLGRSSSRCLACQQRPSRCGVAPSRSTARRSAA